MFLYWNDKRQTLYMYYLDGRMRLHIVNLDLNSDVLSCINSIEQALEDVKSCRDVDIIYVEI